MTDAPKSRPEDAKIPAAVRDAFSNKRLQGAWTMASLAQSGDRMAGIEAACRLLEKEDLTLADVMTAVLSIKPSQPSMENAFSGIFSDFADSFSKMSAARAAAKPVEEPAPRSTRQRRTNFTGSQIPSTISGTITIHDERATRNGMMVCFTVTNETSNYGELVCFTASGIGALKAAAEADDFMIMNVRQPNGINQSPSVTGVRMV